MTGSKLWFRAAALGSLLGSALVWPTVARAEIVLGQAGGFELFTDGRINAFGTYSRGDQSPTPTPLPDGTIYGSTPDGVPDEGPELVIGPFGAGSNQQDASGNIGAARIRSGFVSNVLAFGFRKKLSETTTLKGYFALWSGIEAEGGNSRLKYSKGYLDIRQAYLQLDGHFGTLLVGRELGLFSRAAVAINYDYQHAYALGHPCGIDGNGPTCGHIGFGVMYPGFDPGVVYTTPSLGGLKLTAGLYDPVVLTAYMTRTPYPRVEGEAVFDGTVGSGGSFKLFANALWQRLETGVGPTGTPYYPKVLPNGTQNCVKEADGVTCAVDASGQSTPLLTSVKVDAWGVGAGGRLEIGALRLGATGFTGVGLGTHYPIQHSPGFLFNENTYQLRKFDGFYGTVAGVFGRYTVHTGFGLVNVHQMPADLFPGNTDPANTFKAPERNIPRYQYGVSGGLTIKIYDGLFWAIDVFRQHSVWHTLTTTNTATGATVTYGGEKQSLIFLNTGITMQW